MTWVAHFVTIICKGCKRPFQHMQVHRPNNTKKFCEDCLRDRIKERKNGNRI